MKHILDLEVYTYLVSNSPAGYNLEKVLDELSDHYFDSSEQYFPNFNLVYAYSAIYIKSFSQKRLSALREAKLSKFSPKYLSHLPTAWGIHITN